MLLDRFYYKKILISYHFLGKKYLAIESKRDFNPIINYVLICFVLLLVVIYVKSEILYKHCILWQILDRFISVVLL